MRLPALTLDNLCDVRRAQAAKIEADKQRFTRDLLYRSGKSVQICRSCATMVSTCQFWSSSSDDQGHPYVPRFLRARVQLDDGDFSAWFYVCLGPR